MLTLCYIQYLNELAVSVLFFSRIPISPFPFHEIFFSLVIIIQ